METPEQNQTCQDFIDSCFKLDSCPELSILPMSAQCHNIFGPKADTNKNAATTTESSNERESRPPPLSDYDFGGPEMQRRDVMEMIIIDTEQLDSDDSDDSDGFIYIEISNERESRPPPLSDNDFGGPEMPLVVKEMMRLFGINDIQQLDFINTAFGSPQQQSETIRSPCFRTMEARLASFKNFPSGNNIPHQQLAVAGLYFTGQGDLCRCFHCDGGLKALSSGDDPIKEHARSFPNCSYINSLKGQQYVQSLQPRGLENEHIFCRKDVIGGYYTSSQRSDRTGNITETFGSPPPLGYTIRSPRYRTMEARLATFENFPSANNIPHQQFAEAGLYFTGQGDLCRCFHCNGGLKDWSFGDDPIKEHARYFPNCSYINSLEGQQYVQSLQPRGLENELICCRNDDIGGYYTSSQRLDRTGNITEREDICCFVNGGCIKGGRLCDKTIGEQDTNCSRDTYRNKSKRYTTRQRDVMKNASTSERSQHSASQTTQGNGYSFEYTSVLRKSTKHVVLHMDPRLVLDEFTTCGFLTNIEIRDIEELQLTSEKNRAILRKVMTKGVNGYKKFKSALKESNQTHLLDLLLREELS